MRNGIKSKHRRLYRIWQGIRQRCNNPNDKNYGSYGGRGIRVCKEWDNSSQTFIDWALINGYSDELSIDRINNDGNYCPENCRWANWTQQARNKRTAKNNKLSAKGIHIDRGQYRAVIYANNRRHDLGRYKTLEDAISTRKNGEAKYWGTAV